MTHFPQDTGLHYDRYLREVIDFLEKDQHFREKLHNTDMEDIKVKAVESATYFLNKCCVSALDYFICLNKQT